ncbi:AAA family ATPase [Lentzea sp. NPDC059081]|uniref:AAA family ATPase n=1 Tax=Lentzea sp. NPDC059081 TaxID=3346719 RepID=UPI0036A94ABB
MNPPDDGGRRELVERDEVVTRVVGAVTTPASPPLVLVSGPAGIGRSALLAAVHDELTARGVPTLALRVTPAERDRAFSLAARLATELGAPLRTGDKPRTAVAVQQPSAAITGLLASVLAAARTSGRQLVVLVDDLQWADAESQESLFPLLAKLTATSVKVVGTVRSPRTGPAPHLALDAALVTVLPLRPLSWPAVRSLITNELQARPSDSLADRLRETGRGVPGAVLAALSAYRDADRLRVLDRYAYLTEPDHPLRLTGTPASAEPLVGPGSAEWPVAKALVVLHPLGRAAPKLAARALGISEGEVRTALDSLRLRGVVRHARAKGHWRFRLPLMATALAAHLGPYERRRLAQVAVTAIWEGEAEAEDDYLAEQLVDAGRFVDAQRSGAELLSRGAAAMLNNGYLSERWLRAAVERVVVPSQRARALSLHASACCIHQRFADAVDSSEAVLSGYADLIAPEALLELQMVYVIALAGSADVEALRAIADRDWESLPGSTSHRLLTRFAALCHLDRWKDADELLRPTQPLWRNDGTVVGLALIYSHTVAAFLGRTEEFDQVVADPTSWPLWHVPRARFEMLSGLIRILSAFGELDRARHLLSSYEIPASHRSTPDRVVTDSLAGQWDAALDGARMSFTTGSAVGYPPALTLMTRETSTILISRGRLAQARSLLEGARAQHPVLPHLLAIPAADLELVMASRERARRVVVDGLAGATGSGVVIGTDELWLRLTGWAALEDDQAEAARCAAEVSRIAALIGTGRARLCELVASAVTRRDPVTAAEAVRLARRRGQPYELATTIVDLSYHRLVDDALLLEAYELFGELDALLMRARLRNIMRERKTVVPRRETTVAENERLLATLVTDGLSNRELAAVLDTSEKTVEGRLTRLFQRTGYRSRAKLASAVLTGEYGT